MTIIEINGKPVQLTDDEQVAAMQEVLGISELDAREILSHEKGEQAGDVVASDEDEV